MNKTKEGWTWLSNATKWHYFRNGQSLCKKYGIFGPGDLELGNNDSPDNCVQCRKILIKEDK